MDYEKLYKDTITKLQEMVNSGKITVEVARGICADFIPESEDERIRKALLNYIYDVHDDDEERARWADWLEKQAEYLENYDEAEKEKGDFVGDSFIKCRADFLDFKEGNTYWLEYVGDDKYNVRSDNLLGKTYHITPRQLYTIFKKQTWLEKQSEQILANSAKTCKDEQKPTENKGMNLVEEEMTPFQKKVFCIIDTTIEEEQGLKQVCNELLTLAKHEIEQKPDWSEEDKVKINRIVACLENLNVVDNDILLKDVDWLKSLRPKSQWKPSKEQLKSLQVAIDIIDILGGQTTSTGTDLKELSEQLKKLREE